MTVLPITLTAAGAAALINIWLAVRIGKIRVGQKIRIGDGGHEPLTARMRAHANFVEYTPFVLVLVAAIELAIGSPWWLWAAVAVYLVARVLHPFGMDGWQAGRGIGIITTMLVLLGLGAAALAIPYLTPRAEVHEAGRG